MSGRCSLAPCEEDAPASDALIEIKIDQGLVSSTEMSSFDGYLALSIGDGGLDGDLFRPFQVLCRTGGDGVRAEIASLSSSPTMFSSKIGV